MPVLSAHRLSPPRPTRPVHFAVSAILVVAVAGTLWLAVPRLEAPSTVDLTVENDLPYHVDIQARRPGEEAAVLLGTSEAGTTRSFHQVLDRGGTWIFTFSYGGLETGTIEMERDQLQDAAWTMVVPDSVGEELNRAGFEPPP
jgi:hypothetical protein